MFLHVLIAVATLLAPAKTYADLAAAFEAPETNSRGLPEAAVQFIIDECGLGWMTGWPKHHARQWSDVRGYVSYNRDYCILSRAGAGEWGQHGPAEYCLVNVDSGVVWVRNGLDLVGVPSVSSLGMVALYNRCSTLKSSHPGIRTYQLIELTILNVNADTIVTQTWWDRYTRGGYTAQKARFSPQGRFFVQTMNRLDRDSTNVQHRNMTLLYWVDLEGEAEKFEELGRFWPKELGISEQDAILRGDWRDRMIDEGYDEGFYRITWWPWHIEKVVTTSYPSTR
jgi:hypothetical protein